MTIVPLNSIEDGRWYAQRESADIAGQEPLFVELIEALARKQPLTGKKYNKTMRTFVHRGLPWLNKGQIIDVYERLCAQGLMDLRTGTAHSFADETHAHPGRRNSCHRLDQALSLPR